MAYVKLEQQGHVGILSIDRPEALNALNSEVLSDLSKALDDIETNDDIYVVVLTGAGRSFVAGADIAQMRDFGAVEAKAFGDAGNSVFLRLENLQKPVIAAVNGFALGGGCELCMSCDIRIASEKAKFGQPEVGLGITPGFGGTQRLPRIVGISKAMELILSARVIGAALHPQIPAREIHLIYVGYLQLFPTGGFQAAGNFYYIVVVKIETRNGVIGTRNLGFLHQSHRAADGVQLHNPKAFGVRHFVAEDNRSLAGGRRFLEDRSETLTKKKVVAQYQTDRIPTDKIRPKNKRLCQALGPFLNSITQLDSPALSVAQKLPEPGRVFRS